MIQSLKFSENSNIGFKGSEQNQKEILSPALRLALEKQEKDKFDAQKKDVAAVETQTNDKTVEKSNKKSEEDKQTESEKKEKLPFKDRFFGGIKNLNTSYKTFFGTVKGIFKAAPLMMITGYIGKNIHKAVSKNKEAAQKLSFAHSLKTFGQGFLGDIQTSISNLSKFLFENKNKPLKNITSIISKPFKYMKGAGAITALAVAVVGATVIAINVIKARIEANKQNSEIDHTFYVQHSK